MPAANEQTALVRRYSCLYTPDLVRKAKRWHDGYIRVHHFNRSAVLLNSDYKEVGDQLFLKPARPGSTKGSGLSDAFMLEDGEELSFERHLVRPETLEHEAMTDLTEMLMDPKERQANKVRALEWADDSERDERGEKPVQRTYKGWNVDPPPAKRQHKASKSFASSSSSSKGKSTANDLSYLGLPRQEIDPSNDGTSDDDDVAEAVRPAKRHRTSSASTRKPSAPSSAGSRTASHSSLPVLTNLRSSAATSSPFKPPSLSKGSRPIASKRAAPAVSKPPDRPSLLKVDWDRI